MSSEGSLWSWLRKRLPRAAHVSRIESETSAGIPDVYFKISGSPAVWLELKFLRKRNLPFGDDGLRPSQIRWILDEIEQKGTVWIVAEVRKVIFFIPGRWAATFNRFGWNELTDRSILALRKRNFDSRNEIAGLLERFVKLKSPLEIDATGKLRRGPDPIPNSRSPSGARIKPHSGRIRKRERV